MGASYSSPTFDDMDGRGFDAVLTRSVKFGSGDAPGAFRSVSFNGRDTKQAVMKSFGSGKLLLEGSLSFHGRDLDTVIAIKKNPFSSKDKLGFDRSTTDSFKRKAVGDCQSPLLKSSLSEKQPSPPPSPQSDNCRHQAALKLQKVYKSFRIRRQLADCAVLVEQKWWKLLDFAELKRSSISFFEIEKPETAVTRWSRARTKAAKVGKGLSKDEKARKLALQHWLEAIDPRHRYGHNLQFYYVTWLKCDSREPFFYWLDIGEGKEVNLVDRCCRSKLQQQCIKYLGPIERTEYEVEVKNGKFYKHTGELLDTRVAKDVKWIFVLSTSKTFYVGQKNKGTFQHSSFLAGGATLAAGRLVVEDGILKAIWPHSGHYLPTEENFDELMCFLDERGIDLTIVKKSPSEEEDEHYNKKGSEYFQRRNQSTAKLSQDAKETNSQRSAQHSNANEDPNSKIYGLPIEVQSTLAKLKIPKRNQLLDPSILEESPLQSCGDNTSPTARPSSDGYETAEESFLTEQDFIVPKLNLFGEDVREADELPIPREAIMQRINLHRRTSSYQLAQRLSCTWTTGAGPRISCVRDYPSRLQSQVLEQVHLSPRATQSPLNTIVLSIFSDEKTMRKSLLGPLQ